MRLEAYDRRADKEFQWREKELGLEHEYGTQDKVLGAVLEKDRMKYGAGLEMESAEKQHVWDVADEMRKRDWDVDDRNFNANDARELLGLENQFRVKAIDRTQQWRMRGIALDNQFTMDYADYLRTQEQISRKQKFLPPNLKTKRDNLLRERGEIMTDEYASEYQRTAAILDNQIDLMNLYKGAQDIPAEERIPLLEEDFLGNVLERNGRMYVKPDDGPWQRMRGDDDQAKTKVHPETGYSQDKLTDERNKLEAEIADYDARLREVMTQEKTITPNAGVRETESRAYSDEEIEQRIQERFGARLRRLGLIEDELTPVVPSWPDSDGMLQGGNLGSAAGVPQVVAPLPAQAVNPVHADAIHQGPSGPTPSQTSLEQTELDRLAQHEHLGPMGEGQIETDPLRQKLRTARTRGEQFEAVTAIVDREFNVPREQQTKEWARRTAQMLLQNRELTFDPRIQELKARVMEVLQNAQ